MHLNSIIRINQWWAFGLAALCVQTPQFSRAATLVPCGVPIESQTWTAAGSPYLVTCDVQVDSLMIDPGVTVLFLSNSVLRVTGLLMANGTAGNPVVFTSTNPAVKWQGIFFQEVAPGSVLEHCVIEGSGNSGVRVQNCVVETRYCVFRNNMAAQGGAFNISNTFPGLGEFRIIGCTFSNNSSSVHGGAVRANMGNNSIQFVQCTIVNNTANPTLADGSYFGGGVYITGDSEFSNCHIIGNLVRACGFSTANPRRSYGGGAYLDGGSGMASVFKNCIITNNSAITLSCSGGSRRIALGGGIFFDDGALTNINCVIAYNTSSSSGGELTDGSGVYINSGGGLVQNCTIAYNSNVGLRAANNTTVVRNSILYFNNSDGTQLTGTTNICYSDVQGGVPPGPGNKSVNPNIGPLTTNPATCLRINLSSQCVDMGDQDPIYNDLCFPPSRGTARNDMGAHGGPGACCWDAPCECPILGVLQGQVTCSGMSPTFCATVTGAEPLTYQWRYHGTNAANSPTNIASATGSCLTLSGVQTNQAGFYSVRVSNPFCSVESNPALLLVFQACLSLDLYPGLSITGQVGRTYCIQSTADLSGNPVWTSLTNFTLSTPNYFYVDPQAARHCDSGQAGPPRRFYKVIEGACP